MAQGIDIRQLILNLAKRYAAIAMEFDCKTGKELSKKTYELREAGEDLPYLGVVTTNTTWTPTPKKSQKLWGLWLDHNVDFHKEMHSTEGWYNLYVDTVENGFKIQVYNAKFTGKSDEIGSFGLKKNIHVKTILIEYIFKFDFKSTKDETTNS